MFGLPMHIPEDFHVVEIAKIWISFQDFGTSTLSAANLNTT